MFHVTGADVSSAFVFVLFAALYVTMSRIERMRPPKKPPVRKEAKKERSSERHPETVTPRPTTPSRS